MENENQEKQLKKIHKTITRTTKKTIKFIFASDEGKECFKLT